MNEEQQKQIDALKSDVSELKQGMDKILAALTTKTETAPAAGVVSKNAS